MAENNKKTIPYKLWQVGMVKKNILEASVLACLDDMFAHVVLFLHLYNNTQFNKMSNQ